MREANPYILILTTVLIVIFSCSREISFSEKISSKWDMIKVVELSEDVTEIHNPNNNRWISFKADTDSPAIGSFKSGTGRKTENTGKWSFSEESNELYLDSDAGVEDDSYWEVSFNADSMFWNGRKFEFNKRFEIIHKKSQ
jgi:hypothetical protein